MTDNVVRLDGMLHLKPGEPDTALCDVLRNLLQRAESGELRSLIGTGLTQDGGCVSFWGGNIADDVYRHMGAITWLEHDYVERVMRST